MYRFLPQTITYCQCHLSVTLNYALARLFSYFLSDVHLEDVRTSIDSTSQLLSKIRDVVHHIMPEYVDIETELQRLVILWKLLPLSSYFMNVVRT